MNGIAVHEGPVLTDGTLRFLTERLVGVASEGRNAERVVFI